MSKVVIITGSSRGIGAETAKLFSKNGYAICINYISNDIAAEKIKGEITAAKGSMK